MVARIPTYDFSSVIESFIESKKLSGPHSRLITSAIRSRAQNLLSRPDVRYMPAFKIMDLLAAMTELGATLSHETQLRSQEVDIILRETLSDTAPIIRQFLLEAALECARYEPMMVNDETAETRFEILNRRWQAMYTAHQSQSKLDHPRLAHVQQAVTNAIHSPDFAHYRTGPMLQLFSEMLATAREHQLENKPISELETALSSNNALWRRYALKSKRYQQKSVGGTGLIHPESRTLH